MAAINFPSSPITNQVFSANSRTWVYNGTSWQIINPIASDYVAQAGSITIPQGQANTTFTPAISTFIAIPKRTSSLEKLFTSGTSTTFTTPWGTNTLTISLCGGGGGSGGVSPSGVNAATSGGGGGAGISFVLYNVPPGTVVTYTVGAGGTAGTSVGGNGGSGGTTSVTVLGVTYTCTGGAGTVGNTTTGAITSGGAGGSATNGFAFDAPGQNSSAGIAGAANLAFFAGAGGAVGSGAVSGFGGGASGVYVDSCALASSGNPGGSGVVRFVSSYSAINATAYQG